MREWRPLLDGTLVGAFVVSVLLAGASAWAQSYEALTPLLIDLPGWKAEAAQGASMDVQGAKMTTATRAYQQEGKEITAQIVIGGSAGAAADSMANTPAVQMENAEQKVSIKTVNGFQVTATFQKKEKTGTIMVVIAQGKDSGGFFSFTYKGLTDDEASKLAEKFDWKKMQDAATGKK
jgi:hypothetical protein